ncbi:hypothetical protein [Streptomyces griseoaurantiacus]|uniref:hypothetical protein n=1 Tax=Streptomyces griseoaurantiacus TaxID=68213 RepID=UPI003626FB03
MRRRAPRVLTAVALTGAALGLTAPGASAAAGPSARVEPREAAPGGTVTVSVSCDALGGTPPASIEATSRGFEDGRVMLRRVDATGTALTYTGTARVPADDSPGALPEPGAAPDGQAVVPDDLDALDGLDDPAAPAGGTGEWSVDGACPAAPGGAGEQWSTSFGLTGGEGDTDTGADTGADLAQDPPVAVPGTGTGDAGARPRPSASAPAPSHRPSAPATEPSSAGTQHGAEHGVEAGRGGAFTDSPPAMAAGALLMAGAFGAAVHRLRRRLTRPRR